jgi:hypothetical protein
MPDNAKVLIGREPMHWVAVQVLARSHSGSQDYWDGNWLMSEVSLHAGAFSGHYVASLRADEFVRFRDELESVYKSLTGTAIFSSVEGSLTIELAGDGKGHFVGTCEAMDTPGIGNCLAFCLTIDQTEIPVILSGLNSILSQFPVIGRPEPST